jgi:hypothetical protein
MTVQAASNQNRTHTCRIQRIDSERRLVHALVYAPFTLDTYGEFMFPEDIEKMAHRAMELDQTAIVDTNHDNVPNGSRIVESFIARAGDPDYPEGSWAVVIHIPDDTIWEQVKTGELNGVSFEALVVPVPYEVTVATYRDHVGVTRSEAALDHDHVFFVQVNEQGRVVRGRTSAGPDGHYHEIVRGSFTSRSGSDMHCHRFDLRA